MIMLIVGAILLVALAVLAGLIVCLGWLAGIGTGLGILIGLVALYLWVVKPWHLRWGATDEEVARAMPGDGLIPDAGTATRAITIRATPEDVWPWLVQLGYGRAGWYSYGWIDNDFRKIADRILPEHQNLEPGDTILMTPDMGFEVVAIDPATLDREHAERRDHALVPRPLPDRPGRDEVGEPLATEVGDHPSHTVLRGPIRAGDLHHGAEDAPDDPGSSPERPFPGSAMTARATGPPSSPSHAGAPGGAAGPPDSITTCREPFATGVGRLPLTPG